jgi:hypothetical protein
MLFKLATHKGARQELDERGSVPELGAVHAVSILCDTRQKRLLTSGTRHMLTERTLYLRSQCGERSGQYLTARA